MHCFAGCGAAEIVAAVGLSLADLFVQRSLDDGARRHRRRRPLLTARDVIDALDHESRVLVNIAASIAAGRSVESEVLERAKVARDRISRIAEMV